MPRAQVCSYFSSAASTRTVSRSQQLSLSLAYYSTGILLFSDRLLKHTHLRACSSSLTPAGSMPHFQNTPEALMPRSDSKNPAATCRGLTYNGRPCRRALAISPASSRSRLANAPPTPEMYCWQHQDQAPTIQSAAQPQGLQNTTIKERTSIDTLVDRLGIMEVDESNGTRRKRKPAQTANAKPEASATPASPPNRRDSARKSDGGRFKLFCCIAVSEDALPPSRPAKQHGTSSSRPPRRSSVPVKPEAEKLEVPSSLGGSSGLSPRPSIPRDRSSSQTSQLLSYIPPSATPQTASLLLTELAKPISQLDDEGYIYMFWLTPESLPKEAPTRTASTLLAPPTSPHRPGRDRSTSDVLKSFSNATSATSNKTILLKIGRANNVQRRLNEWTRQCGYNLSLIRYYPYHGSSSPAASPSRSTTSVTPTKVPNVHKVERLIHLELSAQRATGSGKCESCGREHREWFEVTASREGVKEVDEVIRRWVDWSMKNS